MKRELKAALGATALLAGAASVALVGGATTSSAAGTPSSAYGLALTIAGNSVIPQTPSVVSNDGVTKTDSLVGLPANPVVSGGIVNATAGDAAAKSSVTDLAVGDGLLAQLPAALTTQLGTVCTQLSSALLPATGPVNDAVVNSLLPQLGALLDQVAAGAAGSPIDLGALGALDLSQLTAVQLDGLCDVLSGTLNVVDADTVIAECTGTTGKTTITDLSALGLPVNVGVNQVNQKVEIPGVLTLTINEQRTNADGTFTVNALHLNLLGQVDLVVASATCGDFIPDGGPTSIPTAPAPAPKPIKTNVPVTG